MKISSKIKNNKLYCAFIIIMVIYAVFWYLNNERSVINSDGGIYYKYFVRIFIFHSFKGSELIKYPVGTTIMQLPFLLSGLFFSSIFGLDVNEGLSPVFELMVYSSAWFYCILGMALLYRYIRKKYSNLSAFITCIFTLFGTMLIVYATERAGFSHIYGFFVCVSFVSYIEWYESHYLELSTKKKILADIFIGVLLGLLAIIRNTNIIMGFVYLLYKVSSGKELKSRLKDVFSKKIFIQIIGFICIYMIQILCWMIQTGQLIIYSYGDEAFIYATNPQVLKVLFSDGKGLFIYSPILLYSIIGMFIDKKNKDLKWPMWIIIALQTYIISAWWCWWLGDAYGERIYCDILGVFAIPMAGFLYKLERYVVSQDIGRNRRIYRSIIYAIILCIGIGFVCLNLIWVDGCHKWMISSNLGTWYSLKIYLKKIIKSILM